jgi:hypothetical protein
MFVIKNTVWYRPAAMTGVSSHGQPSGIRTYAVTAGNGGPECGVGGVSVADRMGDNETARG